MRHAEVIPVKQGQIIQLPGAVVEIKKLLQIDTKEYALAMFTAEPGFKGPGSHVHSEHVERFQILEGKFDFMLGKETVSLDAGTYLEIPAGMAHDFSNPGPDKARWFGIVCPEEIDLYPTERTSRYQ